MWLDSAIFLLPRCYQTTPHQGNTTATIPYS